ncbi:MAG TPA: metal-dependent hydrolase [Longimicrobiales bacterium]
MPLPLAHTIVGYSVAAATGVRFRRERRTAILFSLFVANMPDVDFLPGALRDQPSLYHRTIAHTIPAGIVCALITTLVITRFRGRFREMFLLGLLVYCSHLVADMVNFSGGNPGVQILWPLSTDWFSIPTPFAHQANSPLNFDRGVGSISFFESFRGLGFFRALLLQALLFAPLLPLAWWIRSKVTTRRSAATAERRAGTTAA